MLPAGSSSYLFIRRLDKYWVYPEIYEPEDATHRSNLIRQIRASVRLARALGAVARLEPEFNPTWSAWPPSPQDSSSLAAWKVELRRAQGYAVASHHQHRTPIPAHVKREVRAQFDSAGQICELCSRRVEPSDRTHFDHIQPWWDGGDDSVANLRVVHAHCNSHRSRGIGGFGGSGLRSSLEGASPRTSPPSQEEIAAEIASRSAALDALLARVLRDRPRPARAVRELAANAGYVESEVRTARARLGIQSVRTDPLHLDGWTWQIGAREKADWKRGSELKDTRT